MANPEHLKILRERVRIWNKWRNEKPNIQPDLSGADLTRLQLHKRNLRGADLHEANLSGINLPGADFRRADLSGAKLSGANLRGTKMSEAKLDGADLSEGDLDGADLSRASLNGASLIRAKLVNTKLAKANLNKANVRVAEVFFANMEGANLEDADFSYSSLVGTNLTDANMTGIKLYGTSRDDWIIKGVDCKYVYWDFEGKQRSPKDWDLEPGEFERLYEAQPTIEYIFENGMSPIDLLIMDRVVQTVRERRPEFNIKIDSINARGLAPSAKFTVKHEEQIEPALEEVTKEYELKVQQIESVASLKLLPKIKYPLRKELEEIPKEDIKEYNKSLEKLETKLYQVESERDRYYKLVARALDAPKEVKLISAGPGAIVATDGSTVSFEQHINNALELQKAITDEPEESDSFAKVAKKTALEIIGEAIKDIAKGQVKEAAKQIVKLGKDLGPIIAKTAAYTFFKSIGT